MTTTDLHTLLAAPTMSRATFFSEFLGEPSKTDSTNSTLRKEPIADELAAKDSSEAAADDDPQSATGFPA